MNTPPPNPRTRPPTEPIVITEGVVPTLRALALDFANFCAILTFYLCTWIVGGAAYMLDNAFRTQLFERYLRFVEWVDHKL